MWRTGKIKKMPAPGKFGLIKDDARGDEFVFASPDVEALRLAERDRVRYKLMNNVQATGIAKTNIPRGLSKPKQGTRRYFLRNIHEKYRDG
jgi:hypothetical protein